MPVLANQKHEIFAQLVAEGTNASQAYLEAGYNATGGAIKANASRLLSSANVKARIAELNAKTESAVIRLIAVDKAWVIEQLIDNAKLAKDEGQIGPANRAIELIGKELGMFIDRKEMALTVKPIEDMLKEIEGNVNA